MSKPNNSNQSTPSSFSDAVTSRLNAAREQAKVNNPDASETTNAPAKPVKDKSKATPRLTRDEIELLRISELPVMKATHKLLFADFVVWISTDVLEDGNGDGILNFSAIQEIKGFRAGITAFTANGNEFFVEDHTHDVVASDAVNSLRPVPLVGAFGEQYCITTGLFPIIGSTSAGKSFFSQILASAADTEVMWYQEPEMAAYIPGVSVNSLPGIRDLFLRAFDVTLTQSSQGVDGVAVLDGFRLLPMMKVSPEATGASVGAGVSDSFAPFVTAVSNVCVSLGISFVVPVNPFIDAQADMIDSTYKSGCHTYAILSSNGGTRAVGVTHRYNREKQYYFGIPDYSGLTTQSSFATLADEMEQSMGRYSTNQTQSLSNKFENLAANHTIADQKTRFSDLRERTSTTKTTKGPL